MDGMRILVVHDDPSLVAVLRGLEGHGHAIDDIDHRVDVLQVAAQRSYDIIVVDGTLRPADGIEVCRALRVGARWSPILLLTAPNRLAERVDGLDAGADDCLEKPFAVAEFAARLRALGRRRRGRRVAPAPPEGVRHPTPG